MSRRRTFPSSRLAKATMPDQDAALVKGLKGALDAFLSLEELLNEVERKPAPEKRPDLQLVKGGDDG